MTWRKRLEGRRKKSQVVRKPWIQWISLFQVFVTSSAQSRTDQASIFRYHPSHLGTIACRLRIIFYTYSALYRYPPNCPIFTASTMCRTIEQPEDMLPPLHSALSCSICLRVSQNHAIHFRTSWSDRGS
jgi:hypothetical protein